MPTLALLLSIFLSPSPALAATSLICQTASGAERVIVDTDWEQGGRVSLTVIVGEKIAYDHVAVVEQGQSDQQLYVSPNLRNVNGGPTSLHLRTFPREGRLQGAFWEISFVPAVEIREPLHCSRPQA